MEYIEQISGTNITIENSNGDCTNSVKLLGNMTQNGTPTPSTPQEIVVVTGANTITVSDGTNANEYTLDLGDLELCKIGDYQDYIYRDGVKWYLHKEIAKIVLTGDETWTKSGTRFHINLSDYSNGTYIAISNYFMSASTWAQHTSTNYSIILYKDNAWSAARLSINDSDFDSGTPFKQWLANNNVSVYYPSPDVMNTEITDVDLIKQLNELYNMKLPYGATYITSQGNLPIILDINYNNWNKDINPSDRAALLDGTATIESEIEVHSENLFNENDFDSTSAYFHGDNAILTANDDRKTIWIKCKPNTTYTIQIPEYMDTVNQFAVGYSTVEPANNTRVYGIIATVGDKHTITTGVDAEYLLAYIYNSAAYSMSYEEIINGLLIEEGTPYTLNQNNSLISWNHEDFRYVKEQGFIGQFIARQVTGELKNISDDFNMTDKEFELRLGVRTNDNTNWYSLGNFLVTKVTDDEVKDTTSFEALDYTKIFNKKYEDRVTYPCTALDLALDVCDQCGIELATLNFKNYDYVIDANVFTNNESCRDVMKEIGKLAFSWVRIDWDNKVYLDFNKQTQVIENNSANNSQYYNLTTQKENFGPVNRIIIGYSQIEGERTKIEDTQSIEENGVYELTIYDNPLVYSQSQRESIINSARDLLGLSYKPLNTLTIGHPWLKGKELFEITDMENNTYNTIPFDRTIQYFGHIKTLMNVATPTKTNTEYAYNKSIEETAQNAEIQVRKATGDIEALTSRTAILENEASNTYTIEQVNQLIQNAETGVTNTFSEAGGNNIFRNTGLWFENSERQVIGKNLLKTPQSISGTADGITYTVNDDGSITMSGTAQNGQGIIVDLSKIIQINEENCCFSVKCIGTNTPDESIIVALGNQSVSQLDPETMRYMEVFVKNNSTQYTVSTIDKIEAINIAAIPNTVINCTLYLQLEKGSSYTDWESYTTTENPYEFWSGPVVKQKEEKASNLAALLLQSDTLSQEQSVPNGNYTISFKYKKLITLSNVKCVINDVEYTLDSTEETEFTQVIGVSSQHINVAFITDIDDSCEIYDLMVNAGSVKLAYSQNQNETTTDTVNISKGITITSTDTNTTFKANSDGIRVFNSRDLDDPVTKFVDTGMETKKAVIKDEAQIVGVLVQQVGSQTWFTKL